MELPQYLKILITHQIVENRQVWSTDDTDEKSTAFSSGLMDFNPKTGIGTFRGYSVRTYMNGEKWFSRFEGKPAGKGRWEGTYTYNGGTGKYVYVINPTTKCR